MIGALIIGLIAGAVAKMLMPGKDPGGWIVTMLLGVAGAALAHFIGVRTGAYAEGEPAGFLAAVVGSVILLALYRVFVNRRRIA